MKRLLIAYATKNGATKTVAEQIAQQVRASSGETKLEIDLVNLSKDKVQTLGSYDNIVLGTSVYMGQARKPFKSFLATHKTELQKRSEDLVLFLCGATEEVSARDTLAGQVFTEPLLKSAGRYYHVGHIFDYQKMNWFEKFIMKKVAGTTESQFALKSEAIAEIAQQIK